MEYRTKSFLTVIMLIGGMVTVGFLVSSFDSGITGAASGFACYSNLDCDDGISCTIDSCENQVDETIPFCVNQPIDFCKDGDGCCPLGCGIVDDNDC